MLILSLAISMSIGTFVESSHGTAASKIAVYDAWWFQMLILFLALSVTASALDRMPWKRKHTGFLLTHSGIILIIIGSSLSYLFSVDGTMAIAEGERSNRVKLSRLLLAVGDRETGNSVMVPFQAKAFDWEGSQKLSLPPDIGVIARLKKAYPHAEHYNDVVASVDGPPSIHINIFNDFVNQDGWLTLEKGLDTWNLGPATISFAREPLQAKPTSGHGTIMIDFKGTPFQVPVDDALEGPIQVPDKNISVLIKRYLPHALVNENRLENASDEPINPACEILIKGEDWEESHTVFANFPEFPTIHGLTEGPSGAKIIFDFPKPSSSASNELRFILDEANALFYQVRFRGEIAEILPLPSNQNVPTGWMDLQFRLEDFLASSSIETGYRALPFPLGMEEPSAAFQIELQNDQAKTSTWITQGPASQVALGDKLFSVALGNHSLPLAFGIKLKEFTIEHYPGTTRPKSFMSDVVLEDSEKGKMDEINISMNKPLKHRGFKIYQAAYQLGDEGPDISVFAVGKDPGLWVKYAGSIIMISGILIMFYFKSFSTLRFGKPQDDI